MADPIFRTGRSLGQAEAQRLATRDGSADLRAAVTHIRRAGKPTVMGVIPHIEGIARDWRKRSAELPTLIAAIRDNQLLAVGDNLGYQSFCCGLLMGLSLQACRLSGPDTKIKTAREQIGQWMTGAKAHAEALREQKLVTGMPSYGSRFNALITPIGLSKSSAELTNLAQLIEALSNDVANAIR